MDNTEEVQEVLIVSDRAERIKSLIAKMNSGEMSLSFTALKEFSKSPKDFIDYKLQEKKTTDAMIFGSMVHCLVLEPDKFDTRYVAIDDADICAQIGGAKPRATNRYKEWKEIALAEAGDRQLVSDKDITQAKAIANAVKFNRASSSKITKEGKKEVGIEWEFMNFKFRGFIDDLELKHLADLKIMVSAEPRKAQRTILDMKYYLQGVMYLIGITPPGELPNFDKPYYVVACDRKGGVSVHLISKHLLEYGLKEYQDLLQLFNKAILADAFNESYEFYAERFDGVFVCDKPAYLY